MGTGLAFLNNLGQLVIALGGERNGQAVFVSLFSVSSCAGCLLLGCVLPCRTLALTNMIGTAWKGTRYHCVFAYCGISAMLSVTHLGTSEAVYGLCLAIS